MKCIQLESWLGLRLLRGTCTVVHPPFATLALVQNAGGAYTWDATISLAITLSLPTKHDSIVICRWGVEAKCEASPNTRQRDAPTLALG